MALLLVSPPCGHESDDGRGENYWDFLMLNYTLNFFNESVDRNPYLARKLEVGIGNHLIRTILEHYCFVLVHQQAIFCV
jgi:hypothetical protein